MPTTRATFAAAIIFGGWRLQGTKLFNNARFIRPRGSMMRMHRFADGSEMFEACAAAPADDGRA